MQPPPGTKIVSVVAPHTSNADFWPGILWAFATRSPVRFVAKKELFRFPLMGALLRAVGGLPVNRGNKGGNFVDAVVERIRREPEIMLVVAAEGTRSLAPHWKTGFYYMALEAGVPIGVAALDWKQRRVGLIGYLTPGGDIQADFALIRSMLQGVQGRKPQNQGPILPRPNGH